LGTSCGKFLGVFAPGPDENAIFAKTSNRNERGVGCGCHIVELSFRRQKFPKTTKIVFYPFQVVESLNKVVISVFEWHFVIIENWELPGESALEFSPPVPTKMLRKHQTETDAE
jgi:hypothetical protein